MFGQDHSGFNFRQIIAFVSIRFKTKNKIRMFRHVIHFDEIFSSYCSHVLFDMMRMSDTLSCCERRCSCATLNVSMSITADIRSSLSNEK
jgi:hypothetical protein